MAHWWRYLVTAAGSLALVVPVQLHLTYGSAAGLRLTSSAAFAKAEGGGNGNAGGNGNSGNGNSGNGNSGGGNSGNGNGNSGNGNGADRGGNSNGGSQGGSAGGNSNNGNSGHSSDGSGSNGAGRAEGNAGGNASNSNSSGGGSSAKGASGANANGASHASGGASAPSGRAGQRAVGLAAEQPAWSTPKESIGRPTSSQITKPSAARRDSAIGGKTKASTAVTNGRAGHKSASKQQSGDKSSSGSKTRAVAPARMLPGQGAASAADDRRERLGSRSKPRQAPNSIVVSGLSEQDLAQLAAAGLQIASQTRGVIAPRITRLNVPKGMSLQRAEQAVRKVNRRASADLDTYYYPDGEEPPACTDPGCGASILVGWTPPALASCGAPPPIGLIDTGIDLDHEALKGQSIEVLDASGATGDNSSLDHGTAIAALLVGREGSETPGLLPQAKLVAADAFRGGHGMADHATVLSLVTALEALAERGVKIVNLSLSGPPNEVLDQAVKAAQLQGIVLVAAVGNNGPGAEPSYPAAYPGVVAVTAVDRQLRPYQRATHGPYVEFSAPGVDLWTAQARNGEAARSGTSYAVPFVSAAIAMLRARDPDAGVETLRDRLLETALDLGPPGRDTTFGYGLVQVSKLCDSPTEDLIPVAGDVRPAAPPQHLASPTR